jgi:hypothetical protein
MTTMVETPVTDTERMVAALMIENTGSHMLDSGGSYGRAWQRTRAKYGLDGGLPNSKWSGGPGHTPVEPAEDEIGMVAMMMREQPSGWIDEFCGPIVDTFHWLVDRLTYHPELHEKYERWQRVTNFGKDRWSKEWGLPLMERFIEQLGKHGEVRGLYGDGEPITENTYNGEDALDRTLQFTMFSFINSPRTSIPDYAAGEVDRQPRDYEFLPDGTYVLLQVHGGADVRGGYTDPRLFEVTGESDESCMFDNARVEIWCEGADVLPDGIVEGQVSMEAEIVHPHRVEHRWDNVYDNGSLMRLSWDSGDDLSWWGPGKVETVLTFETDPDRIEDEVKIEYGYTTPEGVVIRPDKFAKGYNATKDDNDVWHCPIDGSILHVSGAYA